MDFNKLTDIDMLVMSMFNGSESIFMDRLMVFLTSGLTWIPLYASLLFLVFRNNEGIRQAALLIICAALMVGLADLFVDTLIKPVLMRFRPSHDPHVMGLIHVTNNFRGGAYGFFSAHAANTMAVALFFSFVVKSRLLSLFLVFWSLLNCYTRMFLGLHYPSDILCGIICGIVFSIAAYYLYTFLYKKISHRKNYISTQYTSSGYAFLDIDVVIVTLTTTILIGVIWAFMW